MNKNAFLGTALLGLSTIAAAQSLVNLSGIVDAAIRHTQNSSGSQNSVASGANSTSRIMLRGTEDLGDGLKAGFWLESTVLTDTGVGGATTTTPANQLWDRAAYVSLASPLGELRLGRDYTPGFRAIAAADPFAYVGVGGIANTFNAASSTAFNRAFGTATTTFARSNNSLQYFTPATLGGFYGILMVAPSESANAQGSYRHRAARLGYAGGPVDISATAATTRIEAANADFKVNVLAGSYQFDKIKLMASATQTTYLTSRHTNMLLGAIVKVGAGDIKASYVRTNQQGSNAAGASIDANDANSLAVGYVYNLSKRTALYTTVARLSNKGQATYSVPGGPGAIAGGSSSTGYEFGLRHVF